MSLLLMLLAGCVLDRQHYQAIVDEIATGDRDGDGYEDAAEGGDDCDDLDATIHPDAEETWEDGVTDNDCDGEREAVQTEYGAGAIVGESDGAYAGNQVDDFGDLDGDGLGDILVGASLDSSRYNLGGAAYLVMDPHGGSLGDYPAIRPSGESWYLGISLHAGPDLDGDGLPDLAVTALGYENFAGGAWLISGADLVSGDLSMPDDAIAAITGDDALDELGSAVRFLGDVDGDGIEDLAVSDQLLGVAGFDSAGAVGIFRGPDLGEFSFSDADTLVYGTYDQALIGAQVTSAGDQDGDGLDDYMVSADGGLLAVVLPGGLVHPTLDGDMIFKLTASGEDRESGEPRMVGDEDGDGVPDLVEVLNAVNGQPVAPAALLYTTLATNPVRITASPTVKIEIGDDAYAYDAASLGDLDGDGRDELLLPVGVYEQLGTSVFAIHFGDTMNVGVDIDVMDTPLTGVSVRPSAGFGYRVSVGPDVDGDGARDIVFGGPGDDLVYEEGGAIATLAVPR